jgi:hypothetical protein
MAKKLRWLWVALIAVALGLGAAAPARADQRGCSTEAGPGFTCDDVGQGHAAAQASGPGQGFPPGSTG